MLSNCGFIETQPSSQLIAGPYGNFYVEKSLAREQDVFRCQPKYVFAVVALLEQGPELLDCGLEGCSIVSQTGRREVLTAYCN